MLRRQAHVETKKFSMFAAFDILKLYLNEKKHVNKDMTNSLSLAVQLTLVGTNFISIG